MTIAEASQTLLQLWRFALQLDCWCREDHDGPQCGAWFWLDVEAASVALDMATAEHYVGRYPRIASKGIPLS